MEKVAVVIECASLTSFTASADREFEGYALIGYGNTAQEAVSDFMTVYREARQMFGCPELSFSFRYDTESFLQFYKSKLSLAGLQSITGINQRQLSHYLNGKRRPSETTKKRIENAVHAFAKELVALELV
ncbi:MAG: helix-turn-helix transcriptional regulator [Bacteroidales bacterium]|jgi:hypothetical protein|nr:helix-turn-helix transcriptional regulator [Bacteroidales bacterium]MBP5395693.1 helix-turn-helix transcriptional regulator [Bacteroidales bacterium]MBR4340404.1 helix-turn-helix transcriptional regulator [Bacteroidales bacterium]MBR6919687.1 helix-turn-helix transcriptional regulator [Bacteroidales bacterium]